MYFNDRQYQRRYFSKLHDTRESNKSHIPYADDLRAEIYYAATFLLTKIGTLMQ